jgi:hypothetical protein
MNKLILAAALGATSLALAGCGDAGTNSSDAGNVSAVETGNEAPADGNAGAPTASASAFPKGARIVEEKGVTYRIDADGTRVALGASDSRILVEKGVRYRVDPDGTRVKIDDRGLDIDLPHVNMPDVDVGINDKGHPDVDVKTKGDNNAGPD